MAAKVTYDTDGDIVYIEFSKAKVVRTQSLDDWRLVDFAKDNSVVGVEVMYASEGIDLTNLPRADEIPALLASKGFAFPILKPEVA
jgi:uncharacterized protein YuzE